MLLCITLSFLFPSKYLLLQKTERLSLLLLLLSPISAVSSYQILHFFSSLCSILFYPLFRSQLHISSFLLLFSLSITHTYIFPPSAIPLPPWRDFSRTLLVSTCRWRHCTPDGLPSSWPRRWWSSCSFPGYWGRSIEALAARARGIFGTFGCGYVWMDSCIGVWMFTWVWVCIYECVSPRHSNKELTHTCVCVQERELGMYMCVQVNVQWILLARAWDKR